MEDLSDRLVLIAAARQLERAARFIRRATTRGGLRRQRALSIAHSNIVAALARLPVPQHSHQMEVHVDGSKS